MKILLILLTINIAFAEIPGFSVKNLYLETEKNIYNNTSYYLPNNSTPKENYNLGMDLKLGTYVYNNTKVVSIVDQTQFRQVGLNNELGVKTKW